MKFIYVYTFFFLLIRLFSPFFFYLYIYICIYYISVEQRFHKISLILTQRECTLHSFPRAKRELSVFFTCFSFFCVQRDGYTVVSCLFVNICFSWVFAVYMCVVCGVYLCVGMYIWMYVVRGFGILLFYVSIYIYIFVVHVCKVSTCVVGGN